MKLKLQIKHKWTSSLLFEYESEDNTIRATLLEAIKSGANLSGANLRDAYLRGANLSGANLSGANLSGANLRDAYLRGANLSGANLSGADLSGANLRDADLRDADLSGADLSGADLSGADLRGADLRDADLSGADLRVIKNDLWSVLIMAILEVPNLKKSLVEGTIDGSTYEGECACLCGTLEKSSDTKLVKRIHDQRDSSRPIECFFLGIKKGDTPETNPFSKIALSWLEEFEQLLINAAIPV